MPTASSNYNLADPCHYVADIVDMQAPATHSITNQDDAIAAINSYLTKRVDAVLGKYPETPAIMLSGGVDSILLAAVLARRAPEALAVTYADSASPNGAEELRIARNVAEHLGLQHVVVKLAEDDALSLLRETVAKLDHTDPWEVLAGYILLACEHTAAEKGVHGAIFTGAGADALLLGGQGDIVAQEGTTLEQTWDERMRAKISKNFVRQRQIPDFYERLLDDSERYIQAWQTVQAYDMAKQFHPSVIRGEALATDKEIVRLAAMSLGVPENLVAATKNPMQVSSGGVDQIVSLARFFLSTQKNHTAYTNPKDESLELVVSRLFLELIKRG